MYLGLYRSKLLSIIYKGLASLPTSSGNGSLYRIQVSLQAALLSQRGRHAKAEELARRLTQELPGSSWTLRLLSDVYRWQGETQLALHHVQLSRLPAEHPNRASERRESSHLPYHAVPTRDDLTALRHEIEGPTRLLRFASLSELTSTSKEVDGPSRGIRSSPTIHGVKSPETLPPTTFPTLSVYEIRNANVSIATTEIRQTGLIAFPQGLNRYPRKHPVNIANLVASSDDDVLVRDGPQALEIDHAIFAGGPWSGNWYHWTIDILPRLFLLRRFVNSSTPILVPRKNVDRPNFLDMLRLVCPDSPLIPVDNSDRFLVRKLHTTDSPITILREAQDIPFSPPGSHLLHQATYNGFREHILAQLRMTNNTVDLPRKIYLDRSSYSSRGFNHATVRRLMSRAGYVSIDIGELNVETQIRLFLSAKHILGPSGAAWATGLFANPDLRALAWGAEPNVGMMSIWSNLMAVSGARLWALPIPSPALDAPDVHRMRYRIDRRQLLSAIHALEDC